MIKIKENSKSLNQQIHEIMPMNVKQRALRRQGFQGGDVDCVDPGEDTLILDKPMLFATEYPLFSPVNIQVILLFCGKLN